ncbi:phytochelatin synthase family protein [Photobacterium lipolyticum]|uniref:glutathione gamma-glutamylcysteinyltransferase n=1 Tax=Photobacterium lipolyticum TaxID=266810 RepID=A0A2T3N3C1_9GAMM|nr:phytochelatin synthase family protein [Photobacterium lipolyticum]PSW06848.1 phytochelatin synthase [Photobacterium lipolyticum]
MNTILKTSVLSIMLAVLPSAAAVADVLDWSSNEGITRLEQSHYKNDFFKLANFYEAQDNKVYCGVASTSIVLNALRVRQNVTDIPLDESGIKPEDRAYFPQGDWTPFYEQYTQNTVLANSAKTRLQIMGQPLTAGAGPDYGLQLDQMTDLLQSNKLTVKTVYVDNLDHQAEMKAELIKAMETKNQYVVINYSRAPLNQPGSGHYSPVGAYHKASDSFLIMDVSNTKANWVWVQSDQLFEAMATKDTKRNRGYLLVSEGLKS